jgi:hypothetical protein
MEKTPIILYHHYMVDPTLLSLEEKIIMSYVRSWRNKGNCFGSDSFFTTILGCSVYKLHSILSSLELRGKLVIEFTDTNSRMLSLGNDDKHPINHNDYFNTTDIDIFNV